MRGTIVRRVFALALLATMVARSWALDPAIVGTWEFTEDGETSRLVFGADGKATVDGEAMGFSAEGGAMKLRPSTVPGLELDARYAISGDTLRLTMFDESTTYRRVGGGGTAGARTLPPLATPAAGAPSATGSNPLARQGGGNPLARKAASAFAGRWSGDGVILELSGPDSALQGGLVVDGTLMPATATASGDQLKGTFEAGGAQYSYTATRRGEALELVSDGARYTLHAVPGALETAPGVPAGYGPTTATAPTGGFDAAGTATAGAGDGSMLSVPGSGYEVPLLGGFFEMQSQGALKLLGSKTTPGMMIVLYNPSLSAAQIDQGATTGYQDESLQLTPTSTPTSLAVEGGRGQMVPVSGVADGQQVVGILTGVARPEGGGLVIAALTTAPSWAQLQPVAERTMRGVRLFAPQTTARLEQARAALAGHSLVIAFNNSTVSQNSDGYYTGTATNSFRAWHCCANGQGRYEGARSSSFQGGGIIGSSESGAGPSDGAWTLDEAGDAFLLTFQFADGSSQSWTLTVDENENVYVDGERAKVTTDSICQ